MSKKYFPVEQLTHIHTFLHTHADRLDVGCGLQIHRRAWECGSEMLATLWLKSAPVQEMSDRPVEILLTNSLEAERRHAEIKKWGSSKLTHISTASRNAITTRVLRWRQGQCDLLAAAQREIQKLVRTNLQALGSLIGFNHRGGGI